MTERTRRAFGGLTGALKVEPRHPQARSSQCGGQWPCSRAGTGAPAAETRLHHSDPPQIIRRARLLHPVELRCCYRGIPYMNNSGCQATATRRGHGERRFFWNGRFCARIRASRKSSGSNRGRRGAPASSLRVALGESWATVRRNLLELILKYIIYQW